MSAAVILSLYPRLSTYWFIQTPAYHIHYLRLGFFGISFQPAYMWAFIVLLSNGWCAFVEKTESLKKNYQFRLVYNKGKSIANRFLVLYVLRNGKDINRLGISVSKKVGKSVVRSRVTRLIRENYRLLENNILAGYDFVFIARVNAKDAPYDDINKSMSSLLKKHSLISAK